MTGFDTEQFINEFIQEGLTLIDDAMVQLPPQGCDRDAINAIFRCLHTLKGASGLLQLTALSSFVHAFEDPIRFKQERKQGLDADETEIVLQGFRLLQEAVVKIQDHSILERPEYATFLLSLERIKTTSASLAKLELLIQELREVLGTDADFIDPSPLLPAIDAMAKLIGKSQAEKSRRLLPVDYNGIEQVMLAGCDITELVKRQLKSYELVALEGKTAFAGLDRLQLDADLVTLKGLLDGAGQHLLGWDIIEDLCELSPEVVEEAFKRLWEENMVPHAEIVFIELPPSDSMPASIARSGASTPPAGKTAPGGDQDEEFLRVSGKTLAEISTTVDSMVADRNALENLIQELGAYLPGKYRRYLMNSYSQLDRHVNKLEAQVSSINNRRLDEIFGRVSTLTAQLARELAKEVKLSITGGAIEIPRSLVKSLSDPLIHIVRNALDHGLETPEERTLLGKVPQGSLTITAIRDDETLSLTIADNGRGLDTGRIRNKAVDKGLVSPDELLDNGQIHNFLFLPGFSTADKVTAVSGRGVGMDVVRTAIEARGGRIGLYTEPGRGTTITLVLPLSESRKTRDILLVVIGGHVMGIEYRCLVEVLDLEEITVHAFRGRQFFTYRNESLHYIDLGCLLFPDSVDDGAWASPRRAGRILVVEDEQRRRIACAIDQVKHKVKVVVSPFTHSFLQNNPFFSGSAIVGTGEPCLVINMRDISMLHTGPEGNA